jgi:hypothetical protein
MLGIPPGSCLLTDSQERTMSNIIEFPTLSATVSLTAVIQLVAATPGQHAGIYREMLSAVEGVTGYALRQAEKLGLVNSTKVDSHRIWFVATAVAAGYSVAA